MRSLLLIALLATPAVATTAVPPRGDALHNYVLGRAALAGSDIQGAARYIDGARASDPDEPRLARHAFDLALAAGDKDRAIALANVLPTDQQDSTVALVRLTDAVLRRDWNAASAATPGLTTAGFSEVVAPIVDSWILYGRGKPDMGLVMLDPSRFNGFARSYVAEQRAHMLAGMGRWRDAAAAYGELLAGTGGGINFLRVAQADALAMAGDRAGAQKVLDAGADDGPIQTARARLAAGKRIGALAPDPRRGIGWLAARLATDLSRDKPVALALTFARVGTFLAPDVPAVWLICGDVLARSNQGAAALEAYAHVPAGDGLADAVRARRAEVLQGLDRSPEAGALLRAAAEAKDARAADWIRLGDWYRSREGWSDAAAAYDRAIAANPQGDEVWGGYFLRGSARERAGQWPLAEADLREALKRAPDEPVILNYLGYSLLDRGERADEARGLIERAAKLRPGDGGIIDSLGWAQYRQGQFADAVVTLEQAVTLEPTDATVGTHLGDAYWRVGRRIEARFRWRTALDLDPTAAERATIQAKLDYGLDAALAMAKP